jgi:predicted nucleic acid-binding protein
MHKRWNPGWKKLMSDILVDTGFLLGLYDNRDQYHDRARQNFVQYFGTTRNRLIVCWPILYETVSTRFVKNRPSMILLQTDWTRLAAQRRLALLSDLQFRDRILEECFDELRKPIRQSRNLSAVDRVIRRVLSNPAVRIGAFLTFNPGDFADVCAGSNTPMVS